MATEGLFVLTPYLGVHMGPGNYGLFPVHVLPIFLPHYSLFIREKYVQLIVYK